MKKILTALVASLACFSIIHAKGELPLVGKIIDASSRPIVSAQVLFKQTGYSTVTDAHGQFQYEFKPDSLKAGINTEDLFQVKDQGISFLVLRSQAPVRIQVFDEISKQVFTILDSTLSRGRFHLSPLASLYHQLKLGVYRIRFEIGHETYYHRIPFSKQKARPGLFPEVMSQAEMAKIVKIPLDTLVISKAGHRTATFPVLMHSDTLPEIILFPEKILPWRTDDSAYLKAIGSGVEILALLTTGESVPRTGDSSRAYRMGGIPDGLGLRAINNQVAQLFMNHEIASFESIHAEIPGPAHRGAYISEFLLNRKDAHILSGGIAYNKIHLGGWNAALTPTFGNFCSGFLGGSAEGLTTPIYLTGEETKEDSLTFSKKGGHAVAVADNKAYVLPDFGRMSFENIVVVPTNNPKQTVAFALEDGPSHGSQLYMYVGEKIISDRNDHVLLRNGLLGGKLYVFATSDQRDEGEFTKGVLQGKWVEPIKGRPNLMQGLSEVSREDLDTWSRVSQDGHDSSFNFDRIEDGTYDRNEKGVFYFATTGDPKSNRNRFGRIYKLAFDPTQPLSVSKPPRLEIIMAGDSANGFVSPDNMDLDSEGHLMICEDLNLAMPRLPALWMMDLKSKGLRKIAEINYSAVPAESRPSGKSDYWETTGIIDASSVLGRGKWLVNVQAHSISNSQAGAFQNLPASQNLVQGGQLLMLTVKP